MRFHFSLHSLIPNPRGAVNKKASKAFPGSLLKHTDISLGVSDASSITLKQVDLESVLPWSAMFSHLEPVANQKAMQLVSRNSASDAPSVPLHGPLFGRFMAKVSEKNTLVAESLHLSKGEAAEVMRRQIVDGQYAMTARPENKIRMMLALYAIRETEEAKKALQSVMATHPVFSRVKPDQVWKMVIDGRAQLDEKHAEMIFENEPGYLAGMYRGLVNVLQNNLTPDNRLSAAERLEQLHDIATSRVITRDSVQTLYDHLQHGEQPTHKKQQWLESAGRLTAEQSEEPHQDRLTEANDPVLEFMIPGYRKAGASLSLLSGKNMSEKGFQELRHHYEGEDSDTLPYMLIHGVTEEALNKDASYADFKNMTLLCLAPYLMDASFEPKTYAERLLSSYKKNMQGLTDEKQKLTEIVKLCQSLEQSHGFTDGNARTFGFLFLNQLLLENHLTPCKLADPNQFDGFSVEELVGEIQQGQKAFKKLLLLPPLMSFRQTFQRHLQHKTD